MIEHFNITSIGYSHVKADKVCQDHSLSYFDGERTIITACDGHGGDVYIRSHKGSKFASLATLRAMLDAESLSFRKYTAEEIEHNLALAVGFISGHDNFSCKSIYFYHFKCRIVRSFNQP